MHLGTGQLTTARVIVMSFSAILFSFTGRLNRARYWLAAIGVGFASSIPLGIASAVTGSSAMALLTEAFIYLFMTWIYLALMAKRLHDRNKSALWLLLFYFGPVVLLVPLLLPAVALSAGVAWLASILAVVGVGIALWAFIELGFLRGTTGPNNFGSDPLQAQRAA
jgi:uncharacterized membrane protein YhaH (DUF805 family)